ncbi:MAG: tRNA (N6-threonylcarbamoyladenosine(37)-N6)-methyltransferase TrmO [Sulfolobales archaeon]
MEIVLRPIGFIRVGFSDDVVRESFEGVDGDIEILPEYEEGLAGIDGFSHLIIIAYLHKISAQDRVRLRVRPRKWIRLGLSEDEVPEVGVFCTDSPFRPNPIALSIVRLVGRSGRVLHVRGLDLFDGTPVLDIKPYTYSRRVDSIGVPGWYSDLLNRIRRIYPDAREI